MIAKEEIITPDNIKIKQEKRFDKTTLVIYRFDKEEKALINRLNAAIIMLSITLVLIAFLFLFYGILIYLNIPNIDVYIKEIISTIQTGGIL